MLKPQNAEIDRRRVRTARLCLVALAVALATAFILLVAPELVALAALGVVVTIAILGVATMTRPRHRKELME
jgi:hypothetical protein